MAKKRVRVMEQNVQRRGLESFESRNKASERERRRRSIGSQRKVGSETNSEGLWKRARD